MICRSGRVGKGLMMKRSELYTGAALSVLAGFMICFFAPIDLYMTNSGEFWFDLVKMFPVILVMFLLGTTVNLLAFVIASVISMQFFKACVFLETALLLILYIQGNYLAAHLPNIDGNEIVWAEYRRDMIISWILIIVVFAVLLFLFLRLKAKAFNRVVNYLSIGILLMLIITTIVEVISGRDRIRKDLSITVTDSNMMELSKNRNVIVMVVDWTGAEYFEKMLEQHPEYMETFEDFIFYNNTMGMYPFTVFSIPYILTGERYEGQEAFAGYFNNALNNAPLFKKIEEEAYQISVYETNLLLGNEIADRCVNVRPAPSAISSFPLFAKHLFKLVGFRYVPYPMKRFSIVKLGDFDKLKMTVGEYNAFHWDNREFYEKIQTSSIEQIDQNVFQFIHLEGGHPPFHLKGELEEIENPTYQEDDYIGQLEAEAFMLKAYLQKLKDADVYDHSAIVIMADHGYNLDYDDGNNGANPILFVKGAGEHHQAAVSGAPVSFDDLQEAFIRLTDGKTGGEVFDVADGENRKRRYLWMQEWYTLSQPLIEYVSEGEARDTASFVKSGNIYQYTGVSQHIPVE